MSRYKNHNDDAIPISDLVNRAYDDAHVDVVKRLRESRTGVLCDKPVYFDPKGDGIVV